MAELSLDRSPASRLEGAFAEKSRVELGVSPS